MASEKRAHACQRPNKSFMLFAVRFSWKYDKCEVIGPTASRQPYYIRFLLCVRYNFFIHAQRGVPVCQIPATDAYPTVSPAQPFNGGLSICFRFRHSMALKCKVIIIRLAAHCGPMYPKNSVHIRHNKRAGIFPAPSWKVSFLLLHTYITLWINIEINHTP